MPETLTVFPNLQQDKVHPAIAHIHQLHAAPASKKLKEFLMPFQQAKIIKPSLFAEGIKKFSQIANLGFGEKELFYGDRFHGLHYANDLKAEWDRLHSQSIAVGPLMSIVPSPWEGACQDGFCTLIYKGQKPAEALDQLLKGPAVIDCGMFCQLALWFGLRYMLGDERFNQAFGQAPLFITQSLFNPITDSTRPFEGNPLYCFLSFQDKAPAPEEVSIDYVSNALSYLWKHPGGGYAGQNSLVLQGLYHVFDPAEQQKQGQTKASIETVLLTKLNAEQDAKDRAKLALMAETPEEIQPRLGHTFGELIALANTYKDFILTEEGFQQSERQNSLPLVFDLQKLSLFLKQLEGQQELKPCSYQALPISNTAVSQELLDRIPFENRHQMSFANFEQHTPEQRALMNVSKEFCQTLRAEEPSFVVLSGKAGIGKTAAAVCAAKELAARGKRVLWISEVMVKGWADQAKSMADLDKCGEEIDKLLAYKPDVVFLDDDNLGGFCGNLLLEKIYSWYLANDGKGLFITSNANINFEHCYGLKLDKRYHYPPYSDYCSRQFLNKHIKIKLDGPSLRQFREGQSVAAIVNPEEYEAGKGNLGQVEFIPYTDNESLILMRQSMRATGHPGSEYKKIRAIERAWLHTYQAGGYYSYFGGYVRQEPEYLSIGPNKFEQSNKKTIVLEMGEYLSDFYGKEVDRGSMDQLIRVLNYVHDQGGRRVILINKTSFTKEDLLEQIKKQLPEAESERTWSRLNCLLCHSASTIFYQEKENTIADIHLPNMAPREHKENKPSAFSWFQKYKSNLKQRNFKKTLTEELLKIAGQLQNVPSLSSAAVQTASSPSEQLRLSKQATEPRLLEMTAEQLPKSRVEALPNPRMTALLIALIITAVQDSNTQNESRALTVAPMD